MATAQQRAAAVASGTWLLRALEQDLARASRVDATDQTSPPPSEHRHGVVDSTL
jgi:hypothetical protein